MVTIFQSIHAKVAYYLNKKSQLDGRLLLGIFLVIYFLPIFITVLFPDSYEHLQRWIFPKVPKMYPSFRDLRVITSGYECYRLGYDPRVENPCDPYDPPMPMNYPKIWLTLANLGIDQNDTVWIAIGFSLLFFIFTFLTIKRLNYTEAVIYTLILGSPSVMLGIERGNNDLIIFTFLSISLILLNRQNKIYHLGSGLIILFSAILKLFPVFAAIVFIKKKKNYLLLIACLISAFFVAYLISNYEDIKLISAATLRGDFWSYGYKIIFSMLHEDLVYRKMPLITMALVILVLGAFITVVGLFVKRLINTQVTRSDTAFSSPENQELIDAFRMGAAIYVSTFIFIGNNWAYRLIFLIFTIPQILSWIKTRNPLTWLSSLSLTGIILTLWLKMIGTWSPNHLERLVMYFDQLVDWLLLFCFIYVLIVTLPDWIKTSFRSCVYNFK